MSDKPIQVGDLVMVVRGANCCGWTKAIGMIFTAGSRYDGPSTCSNCGAVTHEKSVWAKGHTICDINRLKRLDPDALRDDVPTREELTA